MKHHLAIVTAMLLLTSGLASANLNRGVWFWRDPSSTYGSDFIVGLNAFEAATIFFLKNHGVRRVYGSYGNRPITEPSVIAAWNERLQLAGIQSQLLLSENTWIFPSNRGQLLDRIQERLLNFHALPGRTLPERFDAIHLDIEPQALPNWSTLTPTEKRDHLNDLRDTFADVRQFLTDSGLPGFPVYADLPVWFDNLSGSIGWASAAERDNWFADVGASLTGITLMPFDRDTFSLIDSGVTWERANISGAVVRCGIEADIGPGATWPSVPAFHDMMATLEDAYGFAGAADVQSYRLWREALAAQPIIAVDAKLQPLNASWTISFDTEPGWDYIITQSTNLCVWKLVHQHRNSRGGAVLYSTQPNSQRAFWRVERFRPFEAPGE